MSFTANLDEIVAQNQNRLLGALPDWQRVRLREVATILNGFPFESAKFKKDRGTPLLRIRDVVRGQTETFYEGEFDPTFLVNPGDETAFDIVLRVLRSVQPDYRARRALDLSATLFFNFVRDISNQGSETHPRPSDRLVEITRKFFGNDAAETMKQSFDDLTRIEEFRKQVDHLTVSDLLRNRGGEDE